MCPYQHEEISDYKQNHKNVKKIMKLNQQMILKNMSLILIAMNLNVTVVKKHSNLKVN